MSANDWRQYRAPAQLLVGAALYVGLPTNSLKLMADTSRHGERYIWIDPPWTLSKQAAPVIGSADYPDPKAPDYQARHESWGSVVRTILDGAVLERISVEPDGGVEFTFQQDVSLRLGVDAGERDPNLWYDDWYARP